MYVRSARSILESAARERGVADLCVGKRYCAVLLDDGSAGLAMRFGAAAPQTSRSRVRSTPPRARLAADLLRHLGSRDPVRASLAVACANAVAGSLNPGLPGGNALDHVTLRSTDRVGMVGYFRPVVEKIRGKVGELLVFELENLAEKWILPAHRAGALLPSCDVVFITGTTLVNGTFDRLVLRCVKAREVAVAGPTTTVLAEAFAESRVTVLAGVAVLKPEPVLRLIADGAGPHACRPYLRKVAVRVKTNYGRPA